MLTCTLTCVLLLLSPQEPTNTDPVGIDPAARDLAAARSALAVGEPGRALVLLRAALEEAPGAPEIRLQLARTLNELGKAEEALATLEPVLAALPGSAWHLTEKGRALVLLGRLEEAEAAWREALRVYPRGGEARLLLGDLLLETDRVDDAGAVIEPLVAQAPDRNAVVVLHARLLQARKLVAEAVALLEARIEAGGEDPLLRLSLGKLLLEEGRAEDAWWAVEPLVDTERDPQTLVFVARVALRAERVIEAVAVLGAAMLVDPTNIEVLDEIGEIFEHRHDLHVLLAIQRLDADLYDVRAWKELLSSHVEEGRVALYFEEVKRVPEELRSVPLLRLVEGEALRRAGRNAEARVVLEELCRTEGGAAAWYQLGLLEYAEDRWEAAEAAFAKGAQGRWAAQAHFNRGVCLDRLGRYRDAVGEYEKATAHDPDFAEAWLQAGLDYRHRLGDAAAARKAFARYLELGGDDAEVRRWMEDRR